MLARTLAKTLNCQQPVKTDGVATDCCDECLNCRKIDHDTHADVHWARPESKSRIVTVEQMRELMREMQLKPTEAEYKVAIIAGADRLNAQAANAFLKTLEEPPGQIRPDFAFHRTAANFGNDSVTLPAPEFFRRRRPPARSRRRRNGSRNSARWPAGEQKSLLGRYRLLDVLLQKLGEIRSRVDESLTARSPLEKYDEVEKDLREKWEDELAAAIEAEYRRHRAEVLLLVQWWLRDVWLHTLAAGGSLLKFPEISGAETVARRITPRQALENLQNLEQTQRLLHTNVQEALALEVGLLKLHF